MKISVNGCTADAETGVTVSRRGIRTVTQAGAQASGGASVPLPPPPPPFLLGSVALAVWLTTNPSAVRTVTIPLLRTKSTGRWLSRPTTSDSVVGSAPEPKVPPPGAVAAA